MGVVRRIPHDVQNIVSSLDNPAAGTTYSVRALCAATADVGVSIDLVTLSDPDTHEPVAPISGVKISEFSPTTRFGKVGRRLGYSAEMFDYCRNNPARLLHLHGLWMLPNIIPGLMAIKRHTPYMISPHGMLGKEALRFSSKKKRVMLALGQKKVLSHATCIRATAASEVEAIRAFGLTQPIAMVPNGVDISLDDALPTYARSNSKYLLCLGRVHPIKGLTAIISAWAAQAEKFPDWSLRIVGPDQNSHKSELRNLVQLTGVPRVTIEEPVFGDAKKQMMSDARLFVLPSLVENFAVTVAESLVVGVPVISSKGAPWAGLEVNRCGWWVDGDVDSLSTTLATAMSLSDHERAAMGLRGREWMMRDFAWQGIGERMAAVYGWMLGQHAPTDDLIFD